VILAYHRVAAPPADPDGLAVAPGAFREQMARLRRDCHPVPLDELARAAATGAVPDRWVAVTLDDGYLDALEVASPILSEYGIPATFFVTSGAPDEFWWDTLTRIFCGDGKDRRGERKAIADRMVKATLDDRTAMLDALVASRGVDRSPRHDCRPMRDAEIVTLSGRPQHTIGAHGVNHLLLPAQRPDVRAREIKDSKARLEALARRPITAFAYPYGAVDDATAESVRAAGFEIAVTTAPKPLGTEADPLRLPRREMKPA
jgi:peptidoglycan/xylan/chitin deacetylase (PgdA/CDA1 family)